MFNIDEITKEYKEALKRDGFVVEKPQRPIYFKIKEYKRTKSITLAAEIIKDLDNYKIIEPDVWQKMLNDSAKLQAYKEEKAKGARAANAKLSPQELSERNRKAALARWNKAPEATIKDIK